MRHECYFCHIRTIEKLIGKFKPDPSVAEEFLFSVHEFLSANRGMANPELATEIHRLARFYLQLTDLYAEEKRMTNNLLLENYDYWQAAVNRNDDQFSTAAKLSVIGNIIDYGAHCVGDNLTEQIDAFFRKDLKINKTNKLRQKLEDAETVLYLGDNCGEIVFDKLFIETIEHPNLTFAVRGKPVINDVTLDDARQVGMDQVCRIIENGADAPSTVVEFCSEEFVDEFKKADLIISKGQGNFEGLMNSRHPNIFFLLIAKCDPIARMLGVDKNDMLITTNECG